MLILATFATASLLAAGFFAVLKGDTFTFAILLIVLAFVALVVTPQVPLLMAHLQQVIDAAAPLALR